jgi:hypothetical protein
MYTFLGLHSLQVAAIPFVMQHIALGTENSPGPLSPVPRDMARFHRMWNQA